MLTRSGQHSDTRQRVVGTLPGFTPVPSARLRGTLRLARAPGGLVILMDFGNGHKKQKPRISTRLFVIKSGNDLLSRVLPQYHQRGWA
jgi:hypothetical protein